nr:hypothetical protein B0A51_03635 [Rachicladosporium sp. CCFEE 5018]
MSEVDEPIATDPITTIGAATSNLNTGTGKQTNATISGGTHNTQYIAQTQTFYTSNADGGRECLDALFITDPAIDRDKLERVKGARTESTCSWILDDATYMSWREGAPSLLHVRGSPGKGKTMLSIYLTRELALRKNALVIYHFFTAGDTQRNNAATIMRAVIWQLVNSVAEPQLVSLLNALMVSAARSKQVVAEPETMWAISIELLRNMPEREVYCVLDGLDEYVADDQGWLAHKLITPTTCSISASLRTVVLSRPLPDLRDSAHIDLDGVAAAAVARDVKLYTSTVVKAIASWLPPDANEEAALESYLAERAQETFLWIGCAAAACARKGTYTEVMRIVRGLPKRAFRTLSSDLGGYR